MITADAAQRALLEVLFDAHPTMLTVAELHRRMPDEADADHALHQLMDDGLDNSARRAHRSEPHGRPREAARRLELAAPTTSRFDEYSELLRGSPEP